MPPKRTYRKKRKRFYRKRRFKITKGLTPKTYYFRRCKVQTFQLSEDAVPDGWFTDVSEGYGIWRTQAFKLSDVHQPTDFTSLFAQYKIVGVSQKYWFQSTGSRQTPSTTGNQLQLYLRYNRMGQLASAANPLTEQKFLDTQRKKVRACYVGSAKPISIYQRLNQINQVYHSGIDSDYTAQRSKWLSTAENDTPHYGLDVRLQRLDNEKFSFGGSVYPTVKVQTTYYFAFRQVE